jgi:hypothetical protein
MGGRSAEESGPLTRLLTSALLAASMLGIPLAVYPFLHGWYGVGVGALVAEVCAILGFRTVLRSDYSSTGAIIGGIIGLVVSTDVMGRTAVGAIGAERRPLIQAGLIALAWLCCTLSAFIGSLLRVKVVKPAQSDNQRDSGV